jgi:hypothetical protein
MGASISTSEQADDVIAVQTAAGTRPQQADDVILQQLAQLPHVRTLLLVCLLWPPVAEAGLG